MRKELEHTSFNQYPVGELLLGLGFFIVLTVELAIVSYHKRMLILRDDGSASFDELSSENSDHFGASYGSTLNGNPIMFESSIQSYSGMSKYDVQNKKYNKIIDLLAIESL